MLQNARQEQRLERHAIGLKITHRTEYSYDPPLHYALQRLRLTQGGPTQAIRAWALTIDGAREEVQFTDQFGNDTRLVSVEGEPHVDQRRGTGEVETINRQAWGPASRLRAALAVPRETPLTMPGEGIRKLAERHGPAAELDGCTG